MCWLVVFDSVFFKKIIDVFGLPLVIFNIIQKRNSIIPLAKYINQMIIAAKCILVFISSFVCCQLSSSNPNSKISRRLINFAFYQPFCLHKSFCLYPTTSSTLNFALIILINAKCFLCKPVSKRQNGLGLKLGITVQKWSFPLRISSVNVTKLAVSSGFGHIYWRNLLWKSSFLAQCIETLKFQNDCFLLLSAIKQKWRSIL